MIRCSVCGTENLDLQYACGVCSAPLSARRPSTSWTARLRSVPPARWRRLGWGCAVAGAALVIAAIPTNSSVIVLVGLILIVVAHVVVALSYAIRRR